MSNQANCAFQELVRHLISFGDLVNTRNADSFSCIDYPRINFNTTPLITIRKTAWKKALREMEWFMSGDIKCPEELEDWWDGQLGMYGMYRGGYSNQFRYSGSTEHVSCNFDQVKYILDGLKHSPNSRRLILTSWNPYDMAHITVINNNPNTPTTCHSTIIQFFVREDELSMTSYQRSCDVLLGLPHNWIQSWALLLYFAKHAQLKVGTLSWLLGDVHLYHETSHLETAQQIIRCYPFDKYKFQLRYEYSGGVLLGCPKFTAADFTMDGIIPAPLVTLRPQLLA